MNPQNNINHPQKKQNEQIAQWFVCFLVCMFTSLMPCTRMQTISYPRIINHRRYIESITFKTKFLPLSIEEAKAFLEVTQAHVDKRPAAPEAAVVLAQVTRALQAAIDAEPGWSRDGVFVKTSSRSAKDAAVAQANLIRCYKEVCTQE